MARINIGLTKPTEIWILPRFSYAIVGRASKANYGYLYQYVSQPGGNTWIEILELNPTIYSKNFLTTYSNGQASITIPISDIVTSTATPLVAENFGVQYNIVNDNPVAASMSIPALVGDGEDLVINFKAVEHRTDVDSGPYGDWAVLEGQVTTHLHITIIGVDEES